MEGATCKEGASEEVFVPTEAVASEASAASISVTSEGGAKQESSSSQEEPGSSRKANGVEEAGDVWRRRQSLRTSGDSPQTEGTGSPETPRAPAADPAEVATETDGESGMLYRNFCLQICLRGLFSVMSLMFL